MRLMDLLTEADKNKLQGIAKKNNKKKTNKHTYTNKNKSDMKKSVDKNKKSKIRINGENKIKRKKRYLNECPYCASIELDITPNGYYYCNNCGFKIEKI